MVLRDDSFSPADYRNADENPATATFYLSDEGGPLRTLFGMAHRHVFAINRDPKVGWPLPTEGVTERAWSMRCATDPEVTGYQTQPFRMEYVVDGTLASWLPDYWVLWRDGVLEIGEIKIDPDGLPSNSYVAKLRTAFGIFARHGWKGQVRYRNDIEGTVDRQVNVATLYPDRAATISQVHRQNFRRLWNEGATLCFGDLVAELDPVRPMGAQAVAHRLICMGRVYADLDILLTDDTLITLRSRSRLVSPFRAVVA